ncbi:MAG: hypothetical protein AUI10_04990 [Actinobacteria bacterium 13_2_20CM_2_72_6]|nr:MAG: hypothetical protein AUI10_04990 [Actinobacteria bacterium 13_2_20CM_2_72_6]
MNPVWLVATVACDSVAVSAWNSVPGCDVATEASSQSTFGPPLAVVAVARTLLSPAFTAAVIVTVCQVSQLPVPGNDCDALTTCPLTLMLIGRSTVVPLATRSPSVAVPPAVALTVHSTKLPLTLV